MNHINLLNNAISQTDAQPAQPAQANAVDSSAARDVAVSGIAQARITDANTLSSAPPESARPSSPAPCLSNPRMTLERFEEELRLWCKEKSGTDEYPNRIRAKEKMIECFKTWSASLNLSELQLTSLPDAIGSLTSLHVLKLPCNQLTSLPSAIGSLTSLQILYLYCNQLTSIPNAIGSLTSLCNFNATCNHLTSLPDSIGSLTSLQELYLTRNQFNTIPEAIGSFTRLRELLLPYNPLTSLPDSILTLSHDCWVNLSNTNLSVSVLTHLSEETARDFYHGPQFDYSMPTISIPQEQPLATIIPELYRIIGRPGRAFPRLEASDQSHHLQSWLNRLSCTATYQRGGDAQGQFVSQIVRYLETAEENEEFQSIFMPILSDASETCGDRVALSILHVGVQHRLHHFDLNDPKGLSQFLICGPMTLSILEQYARELIPTFRFVDEIEVYLGLPVMLKDRLSIPIDVSEMLYFRCSNLTEAHLGIATARVHAEIDDLGMRNQFLIGQPKWLEALEKHFPSEIAAIQEEYLQKLESASNPLSVRAEYEERLKTLTKQLLQ